MSTGGTASPSPSLSGQLPVEADSGATGAPLGVAQIGQPQQHEVVLVVFIGGVTFSEISALRFLASRPSSRQR